MKKVTSLGMASKEVNMLTKLIHKRHGIILVADPTGSGKTATAYTCMRILGAPQTRDGAFGPPSRPRMRRS